MFRCPRCQKDGARVLLRPHYTRVYHEFICGYCQLEMQFRVDPTIPMEAQLSQNYASHKKYDMLEFIDKLQKKVDSMSDEQKIARLQEIDESSDDNDEGE